MRTTLTLDDDTAQALRRMARESGASWKQVVNEAIRAGIRALEVGAHPHEEDWTPPVDLGVPRLDLDDVHGALAVVEGDART